MHGMLPPTWFVLLALAALLSPFWWPIVVVLVLAWLWRSQRRVAFGVTVGVGVMVELGLIAWLVTNLSRGY